MGHSITFVIALVLWLILSVISSMEYLPHTKEMNTGEKILFVLIFAVGGPIFGLNEILTTLLECIMPEGWDDDGDGKDDFYKRY